MTDKKKLYMSSLCSIPIQFIIFVRLLIQKKKIIKSLNLSSSIKQNAKISELTHNFTIL